MNDLDDKLREILEDWYPGVMYENVIPKIKKLYADEVTPKVDTIMQDMVNLQANLKYDMLRLGMTPTPVNITADFSKGKLSELMTGQEWYDNFVKEWLKVNHTDLKTYEILEIAKKSSGIKGV